MVKNKNYLKKEWDLLIDDKNDVFNFFKDNISNGIWYWDLENPKEKWFDSKFWSLLGYRNHDAKYSIDDWKTVVHPDDLLLLDEKIEKYLNSNSKQFTLTIRFLCKDGSMKWLNCIAKSMLSDFGVPKRMLFVFQDVSENNKQEEKFLKMERIYSQMKQVAKIGHWEVNVIKNELYWSDYCKIIHEVQNDFIPDIFNGIGFFKEGKNRDTITRVIDNCLNNGTPYDEELQIVTATNKTIWVRVIGTAYIENGICKRIFGIIQDLNERKNAELDLQKSETQFRNIVENANDIIFVFDLFGNFTYISPNVEEKTGFKVDELIHKSITNLVHPHYMNFSFGAIQKVVVTKMKQLSEDFIIVHKNGTSLWYQGNATPLFDEHKNVYSVLGIARDVTDIRLSKNALVKSEAEGIVTTKLYKSLLDNDSVYIIKVDLNGNYSFVNNHFCSQFGFDLSIVGTSALQGIIEDDHSLCKETVVKCFLEPGVSHEVVLRKITVDKVIGGSKWEFKGILDSEGQVKEILCLGIDITNELRSLEKAERLISLTSKQNVQLKSFNYIVSHDIRSHAANISALVDIIPNVMDTNEREAIFEMLGLSTQKLNETLDNLNQIISINEDTLKNYSELKFSDEVDKTLEIFSYQIKEFHVNFILEIENNLIVNLIPAYLDSILLNLVSNAIKYRSETRNLIVTIKGHKTLNGIKIEISDNGQGFDYEKNKDKVFGMYKTFHFGEESRGFGLYITKSQVEVMNGKITVQSKENEGTTFTINFNG